MVVTTSLARKTIPKVTPSYSLLLEDNSDLRTKHYRFQSGNNVLFTLGPSLSYYKLKLCTNYPIDGTEFSRFNFVSHKFTSEYEQKPFDIGSEECHVYKSLILNSPGSYSFYIISDDQKELAKEEIENIFKQNKKKPEGVRCIGYFVVDPTLKDASGSDLSLDNLCIETVISKLLGPLKEWPSRLLTTYNSGYNAIHFTPFQKPGESNSCYSISDHFKFDDSISDLYIKSELPKILKEIRKNFKFLFADIVLNHVSFDSPLAYEHPEGFYNLQNSPHLRPAFLVDRALYHLSLYLSNNSDKNFNKFRIASHADIKMIERNLRDIVFANLRLIEFFIVPIEDIIREFRDYVTNQLYKSIEGNDQDVLIIQDPLYRRLKSSINIQNAFNKYLKNYCPEQEYSSKLDEACLSLRGHLRFLNNEKYQNVSNIMNEIISNVSAGIYYEFLDPNGPNTKYISSDKQFTTNYFTICLKQYKPSNLEADEKLMNSDESKYILANQGWVMNCSTCDFASPQSEVYLRRRLIAWGDSVKIRYSEENKCTDLIWKHMEKYVSEMANYFDGFRLDNCHSTPIFVLEHFVDIARKINPNIVLIAELFTNSEEEDNLFVNKLGLTCLIRERMSANTLTELCRIVHRFGGKPVGSYMDEKDAISVKPMMSRALIADMTHDNPCLFKVHSPFEYIPTAAFVSMALCPIASVRGFDELVPYQVSVVKETRLYSGWSTTEKNATNPKEIKMLCEELNKSGRSCSKTGIIALRKFLNNLHCEMILKGFSQIYVDQVSESVVTITRTNPNTWESYILISNTAFSNNPNHLVTKSSETNFHPTPLSTEWKYPEICIPGHVENICIEAYSYDTGIDLEPHLNGKHILSSYQFVVDQSINVEISKSKMMSLRVVDEEDPSKTKTYVSLHHFPTGSIIILKANIHLSSSEAIKSIMAQTKSLNERILAFYNKPNPKENSAPILKFATFSDINFILFKCDAEERETLREKYDQYIVPNYGGFIYHGLYGIYTVLRKIHESNDLGHPLNQNLRDGYWLLDHTINRMEQNESIKDFKIIVSALFDCLKTIPKYLLPSYFEYCIRVLINLVINWSFSKLKKNVIIGKDEFSRRLLLSTFAIVGNLPNIALPPFHPTVVKSLPSYIGTNFTISAGLPHFSTSWSRMWGRDICISMHGLLTLTGRSEETRLTILGIAGCLRHGLIPNLLSETCKTPRYNSRDAVWFFLQAIQDYCKYTKDFKILSSKLYRLFDTDTTEIKSKDNLSETTLSEIIQEIMQRHYDGINFIENNAGSSLDSVMQGEGFRVICGINHETGFVYGGNSYNCGTWMDKMGSSRKANNFGIPATPRDGSAIELVALCASAIIWLDELFKAKNYPYSGVKYGTKNDKTITWAELSEKIKSNFELKFWIPTKKEKAALKFPHMSHLINLTGIYKDTAGCTNLFGDFQLRPNLIIAAGVAPSLFSPKKFVKTLEIIDESLNGVYGMATLDFSDWNYSGYYNNGDDSNDFKTGCGFNYHQGPEWVWLKGYYLKSLINFSKNMSADQKLRFNKIIQTSFSQLSSLERSNDWLGLPELTQKEGKYCHDSSPIQAWSIATNIEALESYFNSIL